MYTYIIRSSVGNLTVETGKKITGDVIVKAFGELFNLKPLLDNIPGDLINDCSDVKITLSAILPSGFYKLRLLGIDD